MHPAIQRIARRLLAAPMQAVMAIALAGMGITVACATPASTVTVQPAPGTLPPATVGTPYTGPTFTAQGGTAPYTFTAAGLPTGLVLNAQTGLLAGTPSRPGYDSVTITATDDLGRAGMASYTLVTTQVLPQGTVGTAYADTRLVGTDALTQGSLPPGLAFRYAGSRLILGGTPTQAGTWVFHTVPNGPGGDHVFSVTVVPVLPGAPASATAVAGDGAARVYWTPPSASGGSPVTGYVARAFTLADALAGSCTAAADAASCDISNLENGTPYIFKAYAANSVGEGPGTPTVPSMLTPSGLAHPSSAPGMQGVVGIHINGNQPGCTLSGQPAFSDSGIPGGAPAQASFPVGAFSFAATGCKGDTLTVRIDFPQALPDNVQLMKFGPKTALAPTSEWFPAPGAHISQDRKTVTYTVRDNGPGDSDPAEGAIADPFAPMLLPPPQPAAPASIPTLSEWGLALLSLLAAALGLRAARRKV